MLCRFCRICQWEENSRKRSLSYAKNCMRQTTKIYGNKRSFVEELCLYLFWYCTDAQNGFLLNKMCFCCKMICNYNLNISLFSQYWFLTLIEINLKKVFLHGASKVANFMEEKPVQSRMFKKLWENWQEAHKSPGF